jgi:hypothetical protein
MLTRTQRVAQIDIEQHGSAALADRLALQVNHEEIAFQRKNGYLLRSIHDASHCRSLSSLSATNRAEIDEQIVNTYELGVACVLTAVPHQERPIYYVEKLPAAENDSRKVLRMQVRSDLFNQFGRECVERHVHHMHR